MRWICGNNPPAPPYLVHPCTAPGQYSHPAPLHLRFFMSAHMLPGTVVHSGHIPILHPSHSSGSKKDWSGTVISVAINKSLRAAKGSSSATRRRLELLPVALAWSWVRSAEKRAASCPATWRWRARRMASLLW